MLRRYRIGLLGCVALLSCLAWLVLAPGCSNPAGSEPSPEVTTQPEPTPAEEISGGKDASTKDSTTPELKPEITPEPSRPSYCKVPKLLNAGPYFKDISAQMGLGKGDKVLATGNRLAVADIDGDGYLDLLVHKGGNKRDNLTKNPPVRYRFVLMNRPDPKDPTKRTFVDTTTASDYTKIPGSDKHGRSTQFGIFGDVNNDGHLDVFAATFVDTNKPLEDYGDRSLMLLGDGKGKFVPAKASEITPDKKQAWSTTSATFLDYDRDGNLDVFVGFWYAKYGLIEALQDRLYKGNGDGTFTDVTEKVGLKTKPFREGYKTFTNHRPTYGVTSCDVDGDGNPDLMISAYGRQKNMLYLNKGGTFKDVSKEVGFGGDKNENYKDNQFYLCYCKTTGKGKCPADVGNPVIACTRNYWNVGSDDHPFRLNGNTFTTVCGDLNNDGRMDLYNTEIRHWHIGLSSDPTQALINQPASGPSGFAFKRLSPKEANMERHKIRTWNQGDINAGFFDFNNDGLKDIYLGNSDYPDTHGALFVQIKTNDGKLRWRDIAKQAGVKHPRTVGVVLADIDNDGDQDLIVGSSTMRCKAAEGCPWKTQSIFVYENTVGQDSNWIQIRLKGKGTGGANRFGIGARIKVTAGGVTQTQEISGGYGHFGMQNGLMAHFGLGANCTIEKIEIRWPNKQNTVQVFKNVRVNARVLLEEGNDTPKFLLKK